MKITIITGAFQAIPPEGFGAVEKIWHDLGLEFRKKGHIVSFISATRVKQKTSQELSYIKAEPLSKNIYLNILRDFIYSLKALLIIKKSDITIVNSFWLPILTPLLRKKCGKIVYNVARFPKKQFILYNNVDLFAVVSSPVKEALQKIIKGRGNIQLIPNPINTEAFNIHSLKEKHRNHEVNIHYAGRINKEKGLHLLVKAINQIKGKIINLEITGPYLISQGGSGEEYIIELKKQYSAGNLVINEAISDPKLLALKIADADIFCYPSIAEKGESFGVSPLEAMALGIPTIVSSLECFKDFIIDNRNGFIFNHREEKPENSLSEKIKYVLNLGDKEKELITKNAILTAKNFSIERIADLYLNAFVDIKNEKN